MRIGVPVRGGFFSSEDWVKFGVIVAILLADAAWIGLGGYRFDPQGSGKVVATVALLLAIAEIYRRWRPMPKIEIMTRETAWLLAFSAAAAILSNLVVTLDLPPIDTALAAFDHAIGFDWLDYYDFVTARPMLGLAYALLYIAALPFIAFAVIALSFMERTERASELVLAAMIGAIVAVATSGLLPSSGALAYYRPDESLLAYSPTVDLAYKQAYFDLRAGAVRVLSLDDIKGLIAFPSYHATLNVIVLLSFRDLPKFFWPMLVPTVIMLATAPVEGGHHLSDVLGGVVLAIVSVWLAAALRRRLADRRRTAPATSPAPEMRVSLS